MNLLNIFVSLIKIKMNKEIYFKVDIYFKNNAFTQEPAIFKTASEAEAFAHNKVNDSIVFQCRIFQYINDEKRLLSTIFKKPKFNKP